MDLSSESSEGPIPWSKIVEYAKINRFNTEELIEIIRAAEHGSRIARDQGRRK